MAIYFLNLKTFGRSSGSSAVGAAAYRSGERIRDERTGRTYDHTDRQDVLHKEIMLPNEFAAAEMSWAKDRGSLWNSAESAEVRRDARTAREYLVALPAELSPQARINLVAGFSFGLVERGSVTRSTSRFMPPPRLSGQRSAQLSRTPARNHAPGHFHRGWAPRLPSNGAIHTGGRPALGSGRRRVCSIVRELLLVGDVTANTALFEREHVNARIDHRTLKAQGIDREPKPHIPHAAFEMERHGYHSVVAERIRADYQARVWGKAAARGTI